MTYQEDVEKMREASRKRLGEKREAEAQSRSNVLFGKSEEDFASKTIGLRETQAFLEYQKFEMTESVNALQNALKDTPLSMMPEAASFGEKMAFNRGFYFGILYLKSRREKIWAEYVRKLERENEKSKNQKDQG